MAKPKDTGKKTAPETKDKGHLKAPKNYDEAVMRDTDRLLNKGPGLSYAEIERIYGKQDK